MFKGVSEVDRHYEATQLARILELGLGVPADEEKAKAWAEQSK